MLSVPPPHWLYANDRVAGAFVNSLARPGGNVTGTALLSSTLAGKRLELLTEVLPHVSRVAILINKDNSGHAVAWKETLAVAATLRIKVQPRCRARLRSTVRSPAWRRTARARSVV